MGRRLGMLVLCLAALSTATRADGPLKVGVFAVDASPPIGSPMAYDPTREVVHPLSCRGVVLVGADEPTVRRWSRAETPRSPWPNGSNVSTTKPSRAMVMQKAWKSGQALLSGHQWPG